MSKLVDVIREHRIGRAIADDFVVVRIRHCTQHPVASRRVGKDVLRLGRDEAFEAFERRAVTAAKAEKNDEPAIAKPIDDCFFERKIEEMSDAELLVCVCGGRDLTDPTDITDGDLEASAIQI
jgi:hypothetical protein